MKEVMWIVLAAVLWVGWIIYKTKRMNNDEKQQELCSLIIELDSSRKEESNISIFIVSYNRVLLLADGNRSTKLSHALSMARPHIGKYTYDLVKSIIREER